MPACVTAIDQPTGSPPPPGLQVIGAGFGRSGTTSLTRALEILGCGPCYHMQVTMTRPWQARFWIRARAGKTVDYRRFFRGYRATVDWPSCEFYRELMAVYPDARVVLNVRDADSWYESMRETLWAVQFAWPWWCPKTILRMHDAVIWQGRFRGRFADRAAAIAVHAAHLAEVRRSVPPGRLLEYSVAQGWQPLCAFLGRPVPDGVPFPVLNDRRFFRLVLRALRVSGWLVPLALLATLAAIASALAT
jgi:Sulfotransferase domain